ncbi:hypothetical protein ABZ135_23105 [Streptomyces sp. NPDC006339]|uniref:hypothetical protein n=1 Tax=Streptomyces sp. NPDC006339 TaxID=3156755 RepID=UPI0033B2FB46
MGEHGEDQEHSAELARPPLTAARARELTAGLREAIDDARPSVAVLATRVRDAHAVGTIGACSTPGGGRCFHGDGTGRARPLWEPAAGHA